MRIKGNEWLRVKQVKEKLDSTMCETNMVGKGEDLDSGRDG